MAEQMRRTHGALRVTGPADWCGTEVALNDSSIRRLVAFRPDAMRLRDHEGSHTTAPPSSQ